MFRKLLILILMSNVNLLLSIPESKSIAKNKQATEKGYSYKEISTINELKEFLGDKTPGVFFFYAPWCGACSSMKDVFKEAAEKYKDSVKFFKIDVTSEKLKEVADIFNINAIPTIFYKQVGKQDKKKFIQIIEAFAEKNDKNQAKKNAPNKNQLKAFAAKIRSGSKKHFLTASKGPNLKKIAIPKAHRA